MHTSGSYHALQPQVLQISLSGSQLPTSSTLHVRSGVCAQYPPLYPLPPLTLFSLSSLRASFSVYFLSSIFSSSAFIVLIFCTGRIICLRYLYNYSRVEETLNRLCFDQVCHIIQTDAYRRQIMHRCRSCRCYDPECTKHYQHRIQRYDHPVIGVYPAHKCLRKKTGSYSYLTICFLNHFLFEVNSADRSFPNSCTVIPL